MRFFHKWLGALFAMPALISGLLGALNQSDLKFVIINLSMGLGLIVFIVFLRTEPPSRTRKSISVELLLPITEAMEICLQATTSLGAKVAKYNASEGILIAKTGMSWRSFGEIVTIKAVPINHDRCQIDIESDVLQTSVLFDCGANKRNIRHIQNVLICAD